MAQIAKIRITADTSKLITGLKQAEFKLARSGRKMARLADDLMLGITAPFAALGGAALAAFGDLQKFESGLESIMTDAGYSVNQVTEELEKLKELAQSPALSLEQAIKGSVRLQAVGIKADQARRVLAATGNALALVGAGAADLDGVTLALQQIASKGKVSAEEINQINERLPQIRKAMQAAFGTSTAADIQKMGISAEQFILGITTELEKLPPAASGISNAFANAKMSITNSLAEIGRSLEENFNVSGRIDAASKAFSNLSDQFANANPLIQRFLIGTAATAAALPLVIKAISIYKLQMASLIGFKKEAIIAYSKFNQALTVTSGKLKGFSFAPVVLGATVAAAAIVGIVQHFQRLNNLLDLNAQKQQVLKSVQDEATASTAAERVKVDQLIQSIQGENATKAQKLKGLKELQAISPQYFKGLSLEDINTQKVTEAGKRYNEMLIQRAKIRAAEAKLQEIAAKRLDLERKLEEGKAGGLLGDVGRMARGTIFQGIGDIVISKGLGDTVIELKALQAQEEALIKVIGERTEIQNSAPTQTIITNTKATTEAIKEQTKAVEAQKTNLQLYNETLEQTQGLQSLQSAAITSSIAPIEKYTQALEGAQVQASNYKTDTQILAEELAKFNGELNRIANDGLTNVMTTAAAMVGELATGAASFHDFGLALMDNVLGIADQFADLAIKIGVAGLGIKLAIEALNPMAALIGGLALKGFVAGVRSLDGFAHGGIVGGTSFTGDKLPVRVNSGEMILNRSQQGNLFRMIKSGAGGGARLSGQFVIKGRDLVYVLDNENRIRGRYT